MNGAGTSRLILASTSIYRRELLGRLRLPFDTARPHTDETPRPDETPSALAERLASAKAAAVSAEQPGAWVIGSDQVAELDGQPIGKPAGRDGAIAQLSAMSGRAVRFRTSVCVMRGEAGGHPTRVFTALDTTCVCFRTLQADEMTRYLDAEQPYDCAGSFKAEGLGISLFEAIESQDPTALIGLPLIATARLLREAGFALP
ncbi:MAG: Maf family nucleotide pyrophosphatase [Proteobacteria bacterium]|nr:Maf family nucleotide pyrophosphatase [Pseudomonadota bacterium]